MFPPKRDTKQTLESILWWERFVHYRSTWFNKNICSSQWASFSSNISEYEIELRHIKKNYLLAAGFPLQLLPNRGLSLKSIICNLSFMSGVLVLHTRSPPTKPCVFIYRNIDTVPADQHPPLSILTAYLLQVILYWASLDSELLMPETLHHVGWVKHL